VNAAVLLTEELVVLSLTNERILRMYSDSEMDTGEYRVSDTSLVVVGDTPTPS